MVALRGPDDAISFSRGKRSMTDRGGGVRSRMTQTTSNGRRRSTISSKFDKWSLKTVITARAAASRPSRATHFDNRLGWRCGSFPSHSLQQGPARFADFHPYELGVLDATFMGNQKAAIGRYIERLLVAARSSEGAGRASDHTLFGACQCCASA